MRQKFLGVCMVGVALLGFGCGPARSTQNAAGLVVNQVDNRTRLGFTQNGNVAPGWYIGQVRAGHTVQIDAANKTVNIRIGYAAIANKYNSLKGTAPSYSNHVTRIAVPVGWLVNVSGMGHTRWGGEIAIAKVDNQGRYDSTPVLGSSIRANNPGQYVISSIRGANRVVFDWLNVSDTIQTPLISYDYA